MFCYYLAVYSCHVINNPDRIIFHYHHEPRGLWWEKTKEIPGLELVRVSMPETLGPHRIIRTAHKADVVRMGALYEAGGVYLDIDTICVRPWAELLDNQVVLGKEKSFPGIPDGICNAIMMTEPKSRFFAEWMANYPRVFNPLGWREASIVLPRMLAEKRPSWLRLKEPSFFFIPSWDETEKIFDADVEVHDDLIALHLWESYSLPRLKTIEGWDWARRNPNTLYGRIMNLVKTRAEMEGLDCTRLHAAKEQPMRNDAPE